LLDKLHDKNAVIRVGATLGLGLAYASSKRNTVIGEGGVVSELRAVMNETVESGANAEVKGLAALSLGLILVGTCNNEVALELFAYLMEGAAAGVDFKNTNTRFVALGIALIYLGSEERSEVMVDAVKALPEPFGSMTSTLVDVCAYAGTGNVLKIQSLLHICSEHYETSAAAAGPVDKKEDESKKKEDLSQRQGVAVLGLGLIAMGEPVGSAMSLRMFGHLTRYGEPVIRQAVPLALALTSISNPQLTIMETLGKYSRDADVATARNAIFGLGLIGAGTNNARLVALLRQLANYHAKDQTTMMLIRIVQGLVHLGKGTMSLNPFHSDRQLMCPSAVAALFAVCFAFLDADRTVLNNSQHLLLLISNAINPRMLVVVDSEDMMPVKVEVHVGQCVDVAGQPGEPRRITGFQTHSTPVLLSMNERAELAEDEYEGILEGIVIIKKKE